MSHSCVQQNKMQDIVSQLVGIEINQWLLKYYFYLFLSYGVLS